MIRAGGVRKRFGAHAVLDGVDLEIAAGERVALLGLNGAGKTTFMRCLLGLLDYEGRLEVAGADVRHAGRHARSRLGYVPQRAPHFDGTLDEVLAFYGALRGLAPARLHDQLVALGLDVDAHRHKAVRTLSGGMLQKVLLALALASDVGVLLLDEPTANLDPRARRDFLRALRSADPGTTVLLASHQLGDVEAVADRLVVLHGGRIAFDGGLDTLWQRVGAALTLWVTVPAEARDAAREHLERVCRLPSVASNGHALGVRVDRTARAGVVVALRDAGVPVHDFWTEAPPLDQLLEAALGLPGGDR